MKRIATVATVMIALLATTPAFARGFPWCGSSSSTSSTTSSTSGGTTTSSTSGGTTTSSTSGGTTTSSTSGGTTTTSSTSGGTTVPEPGMLGLMGMGFIGVAATRRRRR